MSKLDVALERLYVLPGQKLSVESALAAAANGAPQPFVPLLDAAGRTRTLLISVGRGADWPLVAALWQGVQDDLELPPPALAVSPDAGFQVWFSLAEPVALAQAERLLRGLARKYLAELPVTRWSLAPLAGEPAPAPVMVPAWHAASERWSAFIDPGMGSLFAAEAGLEIQPNPERQAEMLAGLRSMTVRELQRAIGLLETVESVAEQALPPAVAEPTLGVGGGFAEPRDFLLAVMNDPAASAEFRIRAACALLPYFEAERPGGRPAG